MRPRSPPRRGARRARGAARRARRRRRAAACLRRGAARGRNFRTPRPPLYAARGSMVRCEVMRAFVLGLVVASAWLGAPNNVAAYSVQEAILRVKPAVVLITTEVRADVTLNCGQGPITVSPAPYLETGTGWFVDGRGYIITNAHVVDPAHRLPPWLTHELKKKALEQACVEPQLKAKGFTHGQRPDVEESLRQAA